MAGPVTWEHCQLPSGTGAVAVMFGGITYIPVLAATQYEKCSVATPAVYEHCEVTPVAYEKKTPGTPAVWERKDLVP